MFKILQIGCCTQIENEIQSGACYIDQPVIGMELVTLRQSVV